jgi:hypothetical protein
MRLRCLEIQKIVLVPIYVTFLPVHDLNEVIADQDEPGLSTAAKLDTARTLLQCARSSIKARIVQQALMTIPSRLDRDAMQCNACS